MQKQYEDQYHKVEVNHWWFVGRRQIMRDLVLACNSSRHCRILEVGCSAGAFMAQLVRDGYAHVTGIDCSADAIERCRKLGVDAQIMDARTLSFPDASMDVVIASDILEHLQDEHGALLEWKRVLKPGGWLIVFVPAFMFLWTDHDVVNKHCRRYQRRRLVQVLGDAGFAVVRSSYWNAFLFPPVAFVRCVKRLLRRGTFSENGGHGDLFVPPAVLNKTLLGVLRLENRFSRGGVNWPLGVSAMALARKPDA